MSTQNGLEIFERAVDARGRILRVEGDRAQPAPSVLVLTFDVGRIVVRPEEDGLRVEALPAPQRLPEASEVLDDEEPWWRFLGQPITAAWPGGVADGVGARGLGSLMVLKLRFREESENPKIVQLEATGSQLRVSLDG
jgi:hypothetical protein